jgi:hypothetical protein
VQRAPFILLVLSLLGGGLICLLAINTTLGATSFQIDKLQQAATVQSELAQQLEAKITSELAPATIEREACLLGMRPQRQLEFVDLVTHRLTGQAAGAQNPAPLAGCPR